MTLGGDGLRSPLEDVGIATVAPVKQSRADAVLAGLVPRGDLRGHRGGLATRAWAGARRSSASQSLFFATAQGRALGDVAGHQRGSARPHRHARRDRRQAFFDARPGRHALARTGIDPGPACGRW
ncbi:hypothetical protein ACRAWF_30405 [Streptomyces sp. L7]